MPKQQKIRCYQSPTGVRQPKCRNMTSLMCLPCQQALSFHYKVKAANSVSRICRRRQAAELNRRLRVEAYSDLCATNMALEEELKQHNKTLEELDNGRRAIFSDVVAKEKELVKQQVQVAADVTIELLQCPWSGLAQLQQLMTTSVTADVSPASLALIAPGSTDTTPSFHCVD